MGSLSVESLSALTHRETRKQMREHEAEGDQPLGLTAFPSFSRIGRPCDPLFWRLSGPSKLYGGLRKTR